MNFVTALLDFLGGLFRHSTERSRVKNAPAMQANAAAKTDVATGDRGGDLVSRAMDGDKDALEQLRKDASE